MLEPSLRADRVSFSYPHRPALQEVSLELLPGAWVSILGPNGSGKSTLLGVLAGLHRPSSGRVMLDGRPLKGHSPRERGRRLAYLPQTPIYPEEVPVLEVVGLGRIPHTGLFGRTGPEDRAAVQWALEATDTVALADRSMAALSGGERQRVLLARALAARPRYLLLDEPTTHLDLHHQAVLLRLLGRLRLEGVGILTILHDPNQAAGADRILLLAEGKCAGDGAPEEVLRPETLAPLYGDALTVHKTLEGRTVILPRIV